MTGAVDPVVERRLGTDLADPVEVRFAEMRLDLCHPDRGVPFVHDTDVLLDHLEQPESLLRRKRVAA